MGRFDRATERLKRAIDRDPLRSALHHNLAIAYLAMGRNGEAENSARRALDLLPTASGRHKGLASTLIVQRKLPEAERVIALEVDEFWRLGLSLIHVAQGRQREADATLKAFTDKFAESGRIRSPRSTLFAKNRIPRFNGSSAPIDSATQDWQRSCKVRFSQRSSLIPATQRYSGSWAYRIRLDRRRCRSTPRGPLPLHSQAKMLLT